jgi:hypothetical protein
MRVQQNLLEFLTKKAVWLKNFAHQAIFFVKLVATILVAAALFGFQPCAIVCQKGKSEMVFGNSSAVL